MRGFLSAINDACAYVFLFAAVLYAAGFVQGAVVPKAIDTGGGGDDLLGSIVVNVGLLAVFGLQRALAGRAGIGRRGYVILAGLALVLVFWQWRPLPNPVWEIDNPDLAGLVTVISWAGWSVALVGVALVILARRFGVNANLARLLALPRLDAPWAAPLVYRRLRPAVYGGFILAFWAAPQMSLGHLILTLAASSYGFAIWLEEHDPVARFADRYRHYRKAVRALLPRPLLPAAAI